jgi:tetratricopeptide (TPR) repeat protein
LNLDHIDQARLAWELGDLLDKVMGRSAEAVGVVENAIRLLRDEPDSIDILTLRARSYTLLAHALWHERPEAARNAARQAAELLDNLIALHPDTDDIDVLLGDAAWVHTSLGNVDRAIALYEEYLRREPGPRHRVAVLMFLAETLRLATRFRDAERAVAEVLESPELDPLDHPVLYNTLGLIHRGANEPLKAQQAFEKSLKSLRAHPFQSSSQELLRTIYGNLGELHYEAGNFDAALRCFEVLLEQYPSGSSAYYGTLNWLGACHAARDSYSAPVLPSSPGLSDG